jgi:multicomponent K+:H+ antiporter subunit E
MRRLLQWFSPMLVVALTLVWLLLNQSLAPGQVIFGFVLGLVLSAASTRLRPLRARLARIDVAAALVAVVVFEIVRSNIGVARIVLGLAGREVRSGFVEVPLDLRDPHGLAALSIIITSTPGTVWAGQSQDGRLLSLHVLDLDDEQKWIRYIKERFETPLRRIFE